MKTAISLSDETFAQATRRAQEMGMSRSEFFSRAASRYLADLDAESTTRRIDAALAIIDKPDDSSTDAVTAGHAVLATMSDDW